MTKIDTAIERVRRELYTVARWESAVVVAVGDDHDAADVEKVVWRAVNSDEVTFRLERGQPHDDENTRWSIHFESTDQ